MITDEQIHKLELELSRLRHGIFDCSEEELQRRHQRIKEIKEICADSWYARATQLKADRLTGMGY